ncbi:Fe-Mn family superoxide dismutase [Lachnotalea glycerini]|uniref:superoxide dismutase n=1 Tax=Lachnotalea glycerini TaxID=1763509 RepID=A0A318EX16_9FIRM|nr:Fe-Mn family superoxide dismutase [Lachnotalea glycerini]PXV95787.1 Fe-Mn family superoxide dismutase [Lachnotalea glycerini]RDY33148.1 superoxide dismutase [Lachnotalea glycerini]
MELKMIDFKYTPDITVINEETFHVHMKLYQGYINKINEIDQLLQQGSDYEQANATYSKYRGIKRGETFALDGVILHELYFQNIGNALPNETTMKYLMKDFGSFQDWEKHFKATAKASRGWAVLVFDWRSYRFRNISLDAHDVGNISLSTPILVLDVYEHAYFMQYENNKDEYINNFMKNINWNIVSKRIMRNVLGE